MSQFLKHTDEYSSEYPAGIDFDKAVKLPGGGSTCDIYKTRWLRRDVFVKRLKEEHRFKPLYLDALDKEFDIGVGLRHPSLPEYREFHHDYIIMDYIDGETLAEMIRSKDPWLTKEKNIISLLRELIDVVDYLHRHNVVHCDIKPDNMMITAINHNLVLIDFDKSYTDALSHTSGHPAKYGLTIDDKGRTDIDFRGIGMLVEELKSSVPGFKFKRHKQFVKVCYRRDVNCEDLREILDASVTGRGRRTPSDKLALIVAASMIVVGIIIGLDRYVFERADKRQANPVEEVHNDEAINEEAFNDDATRHSPELKDNVSEPVIKTPVEIHNDTKNNGVILEQRIKPSFDELISGLDRLNTIKNDTTLTRQQLLDDWDKYRQLEVETMTTILLIVTETFPDAKDFEIGDLISSSASYQNYIEKSKKIKREFNREIERRLEVERDTPQQTQ